ncbi:MAG: ATP-binding protein [Myxococcota bacterium]
MHEPSPPPQATGPDLARWRAAIDADCVRIVYGHLPGIAITGMVSSFVMALIVRGLMPDARLFGWVAAVWLNAGFRLVLAWRFRARARPAEELGVWWWWLCGAMAVAGAVYGALVLLPDGDAPLLLVAAMTIAAAGHIAGGAQSLVATPAILVVSAVAVCVPLFVAIVTHGDPATNFLAVLVVTYLASVTAMGRANHRSFRESLALRYQNLELAERLAKRSQDEAQARVAAEAANRDKTRFLAAASHDLRQPLHALVLFVSALEAEVQSARGAHLLGRLKTSSDALQRLLDGLLDISRLDAGVVQPLPRKFAVAGLARQIEVIFGEVARARGLAFEVAACDLWVRSDPDMVGQILRNLVANALRYTPAGRVAVTFERRGERLEIAVVDTGIGIPPDQHAAVFREFHQLGNPQRDRDNGVGLGLAIVDRLARLLGTEVRLASEVAAGSRFAFELPLAAGSVDELAVDAGASALGAASSAVGTILLVDDDVLAREGLVALLEAWGYRVVAAPDIAAADAIAARAPSLDALVVDFRLPGDKTALDVVAAVTARLGRPLPTVIVTGETDPARIRLAHDSGCPVLFKPIRPEQLRQHLSQLLA